MARKIIVQKDEKGVNPLQLDMGWSIGEAVSDEVTILQNYVGRSVIG